ncbi:MAG: transglutaminase, partial [Desulfuromonas sp.]
MKYRLTHTTEFIYESRVALCYNEARLLPRQLPNQSVRSSVIQVDPVPVDLYQRLDYFGNRTDYFSIVEPHDKMTVTAVSVVDVKPFPLGDRQNCMDWESVRQWLANANVPESHLAAQYRFDSPMVTVDEKLAEYARPSFVSGRTLKEAVNELMQRIFKEFKYDPEFSTIATPLKEVLKHRSGVCQDFAHLAIGCLRSQGLAARYVSGYIETDPPAGQPRMVGADASHAWFSVFHPEQGWLDFDPTNNQLPGERHITVAWGRDFSDVTPLKGVA